MKVLFFVITLCCFLFNSIQASSPKDSLHMTLSKCNPHDSAIICSDLASLYRFSNQDSAMYFAQLGIKCAQRVNDKFEEATSENEMAIQFHIKAKYDLALLHYLNAIKLYESVKNVDAKKVTKALASTYQNVGIVHYDQGRYQLAIKYYTIAIDKNIAINNLKGLSGLYSNMAIIYSTQSNYSKSNEYHFRALDIRKSLSDSSGIASSYGGLAVNYYYLKQYDKAIELNEEKIRLDLKYENQHDIVYTYNNIGNCYLETGDFIKAKNYFDKGIVLAKQTENYYGLVDLYLNLSDLLERTGDYKNALITNKLYAQTKDSLFKIESSDKLLEMEAKFESEKKELQIKNQSFEIEAQEKQNKQKSLIILFGTLALVGSAFFGAIAFINFRKTKKQNLIIENQKIEVELKNEQVTLQKEMIEEKQKEIIDSITYAKRIQQAVLTGESIWTKVSKQNFILFRPKDIVSGDFYWAYNTPNNRSVFCLADCTGHGVPGGFMSMLGNSFLNEIVVENKIFKADEILNRLRSKVIAALEQKGTTQQKDGMDISLCVWNKLDNTLEFAGANNPLWLLRKTINANGIENRELLEYKADKMPIGSYLELDKTFSSTTIVLQEGDILFLSTDGYADQFGGPKGKKYKYKPLIDSLIKNSNLAMEEQKVCLEKAFDEWKANHEQVDDVSIIGIRV